MKSDLCRHIQCPFFGKFSGKAVCRAQHPKMYIKHIEHCTQTLADAHAGVKPKEIK